MKENLTKNLQMICLISGTKVCKETMEVFLNNLQI